jgi:hypothetical protein
MGDSRRFKGWAGALVLVGFGTLFGVATPAAGELYLRVYPPVDSEIVGQGKSLEHALTVAGIETRWSQEPITEGIPTVFAATISYDMPAPGRPIIKVAYANDSDLGVTQGKAQISRITDRRQNLDEGSRRPGGGFQLSWKWEVVARQSGALALNLQIQPVLVVIGSDRSDLAVRNKPIRISVRVNPNRTELQQVSAAAENAQLSLPGKMVVGREAEITALFSLEGFGNHVKARLSLDRDAKSKPAVIEPGSLVGDKNHLAGRWRVIPAEEGPLDLVFTLALSTRAGDQPVSQQVTLRRSLRVDPVPPSLWDRLQIPVLFVTPFVALAATLYGLRTPISGAWGRWVRRRSTATGAAGAGEGKADEPSEE